MKYIDVDLALTAFYECDADVMADYGPEYGAEWGFSRSAIENVLSSVPAADVRPVVRGRWKRVDPHSTVVTFHCSECGFYAHMDATNFCPNCGADMRPRRAEEQPPELTEKE